MNKEEIIEVIKGNLTMLMEDYKAKNYHDLLNLSNGDNVFIHGYASALIDLLYEIGEIL